MPAAAGGSKRGREAAAGAGAETDQSFLASAATRAFSRDYRGLIFEPLTNAEAEARSMAKLLGGDCNLRVGPEARAVELKAAASPRVLHLATHGFFLSD